MWLTKRVALCALCFVVQLIGYSLGAFENPALEPLSPEPEGVTVIPVANPDPSIVQIDENIPEGPVDVNLRIAKILVNGQESVTVQAVLPPPPTLLFSVENSGEEWFLVLKSRLNYESPDKTYIVQLAQGSSQAFINVQIQDVNDNPVFIVGLEPPLEDTYPEDKDFDSPVTRVIASDDDEIDKDKLRFELEHLIGQGSSGEKTFDINPTTGDVSILKRLNYKEFPTHRLRVTVYDSEDSYSNSLIFSLDVEDLPDLPPEWIDFPPIKSVVENTPVGEVIHTVQARDGDLGVGWPINYYLVEDHGPTIVEPYFTINETSGAIRILQVIDAENILKLTSELSFTLNITAKEVSPNGPADPNIQEIIGVIAVNIVDLNDNDPQICTIVSADDDNDCKTNQEYISNIDEESSVPLPFSDGKIFVVRDLDATLPFSKYTAEFGVGTPEQIMEAFEIQPKGESSGITVYSIAVKNQNKLDYEGSERFWWTLDNDVPVAKPVTFQIAITESDSKAKATASFTLTVNDINDNLPEFEETGQQYEFSVCENVPPGTVLKVVIPENDLPDVCPELSDQPDLQIKATDADISPKFGTPSIGYRWFRQSRAPPLVLGNVDGKMTVDLTNTSNFDYERFHEEFFIVEAYDNRDSSDGTNQRVTNIPVRFKILDVDDVPVDLKVPSGRPKVNENINEPGRTVWDNIIVEDIDVNPDIDISIEVLSIFSKTSSGFQEILSIDDDIKTWFKIEKYGQEGNKNLLKAKIVLGDGIIDREGNGEREVDRVDLIITAEDKNTEIGAPTVSQPLTIDIVDVNDNNPVWEDDLSDFIVTVMETEEFDNSTGDTSTDIQREIFVFRARDPDKSSKFAFRMTARDCTGTVEICDEMLKLVELEADSNPANGKAILRRTKGAMIDREEQKFYGKDTDFLNYTVFVTDEDPSHEISVDVSIAVEDINDNSPIWDKRYEDEKYEVMELVNTEFEIGKFFGTDKDKSDKFGKVSYRILDTDTPNNGYYQFKMNKDSGSLTAIVGSYNWTEVPQYSVTVEAIDYYRESSQSGSNRVAAIILITVIDENNHDPEFLTPTDNNLAEIPEDEPEVDIPFEQTVLVRDKDDPSTGNANFTVVITKVVFNDEELDPLPFRVGDLLPGNTPNEKRAQIIPTQRFEDKWGIYHVTFKATDEFGNANGRSTEQTYQIQIVDVNSHAPEFTYPNKEGDSRVLVFYESNLGPLKTWDGFDVKPAQATDLDDPSTPNGRVRYNVVENNEENDGHSFFNIPDENSGTIYLAKILDDPEAKLYKLTIQASDRGTPPLTQITNLTIVVVPTANRPPFFNVTDALNITIMENYIGRPELIREAYDLDTDLGDEYPEIGDQKIYYHLVGGSKEPFECYTNDQNKPYIRTIEPLDREFIKFHTVVIFVSNSEIPPPQTVPPEQVDPNNPSYLIINIEVGNEFDTHPEFDQTGVISGGISANDIPGRVVSLISVTDLDDDDVINFTISSAFVPSDPSLSIEVPFELDRPVTNPLNTVSLVLQFTPQPTMKGFITFDITATDLGGLSTTAHCKIYIIKDSNVVEFKFLSRREYILERQTELAAVLTSAFSYRCNIDVIYEDLTTTNATNVRAHFIDLVDNNPVPAVNIEEQQFIPAVYSKLIAGLNSIGVLLAEGGIGKPQNTDSNSDRLTIYILIAGVGVMAVVFLVMAATCYFNNRSLSRRVRALTATTFGSQMSGLNRTGAALELPNTNEFAIEGSNPMWTSAAREPAEKKMPVFDTESVGSGGSVLIGVEDDEDFKNYKSTNNPLFDSNRNNEGEGDLNEDDYMDDIYDIERSNSRDLPRKSVTPTALPRMSITASAPNANDYDDQEDEYNNNYEDQEEDDDQGGGNFSFGAPPTHNLDFDQRPPAYDDIPMPTTTRRNPLMNMGFGDDE